MSSLFDNYRGNYASVVQSSIDFSGLPHDFFMAAKADLVRELVALHFHGPERPTLLDIGCGVGTLHPLLRGIFGSISGVDVSAESIAQAQDDNPDVKYRASAGGMLPYDSGAFDMALTVCVMHHVPPNEWQIFLAEMRRIVRPGGLICVIEHNPFNPLTRLGVARCEFDRDAVLLSAGRMKRLLRAAGLHEIDAQHFLLLPSAREVFRRVERAMRRWPLGAQYAAWGTV